MMRFIVTPPTVIRSILRPPLRHSVNRLLQDTVRNWRKHSQDREKGKDSE